MSYLSGRVLAEDRDEGSNANISYSVPEEAPFSIEKYSGKIFTKSSLESLALLLCTSGAIKGG